MVGYQTWPDYRRLTEFSLDDKTVSLDLSIVEDGVRSLSENILMINYKLYIIIILLLQEQMHAQYLCRSHELFLHRDISTMIENELVVFITEIT